LTHRTSKPSVLCAEVPAVSHAGTYDVVTRSSLVEEDGQKKAAVDQAPALQPNGAATGNNYYRSEGQNVGNFKTGLPQGCWHLQAVALKYPLELTLAQAHMAK